MSQPGHSLFGPPTPELALALERFEGNLNRACPLRTKHRAALPGGIKRLSAYLTTDRDDLPRDYMTRPEYLSAYLRWFLPWNLYRQGILLQGLDLNLPEGTKIVDLGAGPLTFLLSLWLSRPHLRTRDLTYLGIDRAEPALAAGRALFESLKGEDESPWNVRTERALAGQSRTPRADLLVAANFLNELDQTSGPRRRGNVAEPEEGGEFDDSQGGEQENRMLDRWEKQTTHDGALLLIEPGTRPAGRKLTRIRQVALTRGWEAAAPCPHAEKCPQPGVKGAPWCHFTFSPDGSPNWLRRLAGKVHLPKERASLSFLLLTRPNSKIGLRQPPRVEPEESRCLVVSEPFDLPGFKQGRYGCSERGLVLLEEKAGLLESSGPESGRTLVVRFPESPRLDLKSGAIVLPKSAPSGPSGPSGPGSSKPPRGGPPPRKR